MQLRCYWHKVNESRGVYSKYWIQRNFIQLSSLWVSEKINIWDVPIKLHPLRVLGSQMTHQAKSVKSDRLSCNRLLMDVHLKKGMSLIIFFRWSNCPFGSLWFWLDSNQSTRSLSCSRSLGGASHYIKKGCLEDLFNSYLKWAVPFHECW